MVNGLHVLTWNSTKKPLPITLSGVRKGSRGGDGGGDLTNVQYKSVWNCHTSCPLYNEYILKKLHDNKIENLEEMNKLLIACDLHKLIYKL
jgi:hypothetical protein